MEVSAREFFGFGKVLEILRRRDPDGKGCKAAREGWNGKGQFIALQVPDVNSKMRKPYIYISPVDGELVPWLASQTDLLATDWYQVV